MKQFLPFLFGFLLVAGLNAQTVVLDFETAATSTTFQYFESPLEGSLNNIIANPDPSGINTSSMVADHIRPAGGQVFAGAFSNPDPTTAVDLISNSEICMKVWMPEAGNVTIKLENSTTGGANWILKQDVAEVQTWTEVCFDATQPSIQDPFQAGAGHSYARIVLFFDFELPVPAADQTFYFDDITLSGDPVAPNVDVTFQVDMSSYTAAFGTAFLSGSFNSWDGGVNPMDDSDGDGTWETTISVPAGTYEYKFQLDEWTVDEQFMDGDPCTITDPSGQFVNRLIEVEDEMTVCFEWQSCNECESTSVRDLSVNNDLFSVSPTVTNGLANLYFPENNFEEKIVRIFNAEGMQISEINLEGNLAQFQIDLSDTASGLYIVTVQTETTIGSQKIFRQ